MRETSGGAKTADTVVAADVDDLKSNLHDGPLKPGGGGGSRQGAPPAAQQTKQHGLAEESFRDAWSGRQTARGSPHLVGASAG